MVEQLEQGDFFTDISKECLFTTVHDAVLYCLKHHGAPTLPTHESPEVSFPYIHKFIYTKKDVNPETTGFNSHNGPLLNNALVFHKEIM